METTLCFGIMDGHPAGSRQLTPYLHGDVQLFPSLMHTEADELWTARASLQRARELGSCMCPRAPFLLLSPWLALKNHRIVWVGRDL